MKFLVRGTTEKTFKVDPTAIPLTLGIIGIVLSAAWVLATSDLDGWQSILLAAFIAVTQGILCAGAAVYGNQLIKQRMKRRGDKTTRNK